MRNLILVLMVLFVSACTTVEPGNIGVGVRFGSVEENTYPEGFHTTGFSSVIPLSTRTQTYEMQGDDVVHLLTSDQLSVDLAVTIQFHLDGSAAIPVYRTFGTDYAEPIVHTGVRSAIREAGSHFTAVELVTQREAFQVRLEELVENQIHSTLTGREIAEGAIVVDSILVQNVDLPQSLDEAIANVQRQRQETERAEQAQLTAQAEANRARTQAEGEAQAQLIRAHADAESNQIRTESLSPAVLELRRIEAMQAVLASGQTTTVMIPAGANPLFQVR